jgi:hypothetical protein
MRSNNRPISRGDRVQRRNMPRDNGTVIKAGRDEIAGRWALVRFDAGYWQLNETSDLRRIPKLHERTF